MIGTSDLGILPVAVRIWTTNTCELEVKKEVIPKSQSETGFSLRTGTGEALKILVTSDLEVTLDGKNIGRIED